MFLRTCRTCNNRFINGFKNSRTVFSSSRLCENTGSDDSDDKTSDSKKKETLQKLQNLLQVMTKSEDVPKEAQNLKIPKPRQAAQKRAIAIKADIARLEEEEIGNRLVKAASEVAKTIGGDTEKTEMELLNLYLKKEPTDESAGSEQKIVSLNEMLADMKVEETPAQVPIQQSRAHQVRSMMGTDGAQFPFAGGKKYSRPRAEHVDLFGGMPLGIFETKERDEKFPDPVELPVWDHLYKKDLKLAVTHPPRNIFEQLILWTEQGKIWKFPIDNEQGWDEEKSVHFTEHVFLEHWLDSWCPESGPVRHFMELVCVGLSKNPYLTVAEKKAHIFWYEHYFRSKRQLLIDTNAGVIKDRPKPDQVNAE